MPGPSKPKMDIEKVSVTASSLSSSLSRRGFLVTASVAAAGRFALAQGPASRGNLRTDIASLPPYGHATMPAGIRSRTVANVNGLTVHMLEAGYETPGRPAVLLLQLFEGQELPPKPKEETEARRGCWASRIQGRARVFR